MMSWINPLSDEGEQVSADFQPNPFLWQAAKDKLSGMTIVSENKESGTIVTGWDAVENHPNQEFKITVKVLATELRSDCVQVDVEKRERKGGQWVDLEQNLRLNQEVETAILKKARALYRKSLELN